MKHLFLILFISFIAIKVSAQQDAVFTHYMYNTSAINPAYAGSAEALSLTLVHRSQWAGLEGAPTTQTLTGHMPLGNSKSSLGLSVVNDKIGVTNDFSTYVDYSYHVRLNKTSLLYFGLKGGFDRISDRLSELSTVNEQDSEFETNYSSKFMTNFGVGLYYLTDRYFLGASIPRILKYGLSDNEVQSDLQNGGQHYYFTGGIWVDLSRDLLFKPTTMLRVTKGAPVTLDFTANFIFKERFFGGAMCRTDSAVGLLAGMFVGKRVSVGYSYDWTYNTLGQNGGSHELMLRYNLGLNGDKGI